VSNVHDIVIRVGGESGEGVISTGELLTLAAARAGFWVYTFRTYPAEIKGGHAVFQLRVSDKPLYSQGDSLNALLAFNQEGYDKHHQDLRPDGTVVFDTEQVDEATVKESRKFGLPLSRIAKEEIKMPLAKNMVALGALARLFSIPEEYTNKLCKEKFAKKGDAVIQKNLEALAAGKSYIEKNFRTWSSSTSTSSRASCAWCCRGTRPSAWGRWWPAARTTSAIPSRRRATSWSSWPPSCRRSAAS